MLEKFETVKKVGLFEDYVHSSGCEFGDVTLIYGENGVGKSTLAAILDSLRERNSGEIVRRRSLPGDVAPAVTIRLNGKDYVFDGCNWNDQPPHGTLDVFFPGFVTRNVHAATSVDSEHRRNLCEFVLGRKAVEKVARLAEADNESRAALTEMKMVDKELQLLIKKPDTLDTFLELAIDSEIIEKIERVKEELKQAQSKDVILGRMVPKAVLLPQIDRNTIVQLLEKSAEAIGADVVSIVKQHIDEHLDINGEVWLAYGAKHVERDNRCPFCAQDTVGESLVKAIRSYFSAEYRAYSESLSLELKEMQERWSSEAFSKIRVLIATQIAAAVHWTDVIKLDQVAINTSLVEAETAWNEGVKKLEAVVASKQAKPLEKLEPRSADEALADYERSIAILDTVNEIFSACSRKAEERKTALSKADATEIGQRLLRLENQKVRFEPLSQDLLDRRNALIHQRTKLDQEKTSLKKEIDEYAAKTVGKYQAGINHFLAHFGCDTRIESVEPQFPSGRASVQYKLKAHGHEIELGVSDAGPCFETVLSDGDKYTLALSFFFARLKDPSDLSGRIVVLDDPVNSLGSSRRTLIEGVIRDLRVRGAQVVVLTHDERLSAMMWRDKKLKPLVSLQVERTTCGSRLAIWDIEQATQSEYVGNYLSLTDYLDNGGEHAKAAASIRPYVEQRLRYIYPGPPFKTSDSLGEMIKKIRESAPSSRIHILQSKLSELDVLNTASLPSHHATDDVPGMDPLTPDAVRIFARKALDVLG